MAYSPSEKYPGAVDVDPDYQGGKFRDNNPSTTNNGSPLKAIDRNELLARDEAIMNDAGFEYSGVADTPQDSQLFKAYKASLGNGANLLSNHNFLIPSPDDSQPAPSATPTSYPPGYQIFSGVFANETSGISNLTYIDGLVSFSGGDFYMPVANSGGLERLTDFVASVADFDGKPRTRGVSYALVGDEYRVTVGVDALEDGSANVTPIGSVKFEQGGVATGHEVFEWSQLQVWRNSGDLRGWGAVGDGVTDDTNSIQSALNENVKLSGGGRTFLISSTTFSGDLHIEDVKFIINGSGVGMRNNPTPKSEPTFSKSFDTSETTADVTEADIGDLVLFKGSSVRYVNVDGDYTPGQLVKVVSKTGSTIEFYPAIAEAFTADSCAVYNGHSLFLDNVEFNASDNTSNNSLFVADFMDGAEVRSPRLVGGGTQNIGMIITGVGIRVNDPVIENFSQDSLGYALGFNGSDITVTNPTCAKGRHVIEGNTDRTYFCVGFKVRGGSVTKASDASAFTYVIGAHPNAINPIYDGIDANGQGFLICIRGGSGKVTKCNFGMLSNSNYSPVLITEKGIDGVTIDDNTYLDGQGYVAYVSTDQDNEGLSITNNKLQGRRVMIRLPASKVMDNLIITGNSGEIGQMFDFDLQQADIRNFIIANNPLKSVAPFNSVYMFDIQNAANIIRGKIINNPIDDTQSQGFLRIGDISGDLQLDVLNNDNSQQFKFVEVNAPTIGQVKHLQIKDNNAEGRVNLSFAGGQLFTTIIDFVGNDIKSANSDAFGSSLSPIRFGDNTFNSSSNITINSTYTPLSGNANIGSGELVYGGQNIQWDGQLS